METINAHLSQEHLDQFEQEGFMLLKNILSDHENLKLAQFVQSQKVLGHWSKAQIGKGDTQTINLEQRGDFIQWLDQAESISELVPYWKMVQEIQTALNRYFYLGLNFFEAHMACYPKGTFYKRHRDRHLNGSSRKVSIVYYLNKEWHKEQGGLLKIFKENETKATVEPFIGHCFVFLAELEHEVTIAEKERFSITGWFHQKVI